MRTIPIKDRKITMTMLSMKKKKGYTTTTTTATATIIIITILITNTIAKEQKCEIRCQFIHSKPSVACMRQQEGRAFQVFFLWGDVAESRLIMLRQTLPKARPRHLADTVLFFFFFFAGLSFFLHVRSVSYRVHTTHPPMCTDLYFMSVYVELYIVLSTHIYT